MKSNCRQHANEPVVYCLAQTIYDFLDEKMLFLNDEQPTDHSNIPDQIKILPIPQLSPEGEYISQ